MRGLLKGHPPKDGAPAPRRRLGQESPELAQKLLGTSGGRGAPGLGGAWRGEGGG